MISPTFLVICYSLQSDFSFVLNKHLSSQIHIYLTKKDIFCEENLKDCQLQISWSIDYGTFLIGFAPPLDYNELAKYPHLIPANGYFFVSNAGLVK